MMKLRRVLTAYLTPLVFVVVLLSIQTGLFAYWHGVHEDRALYADMRQELLRLERLVIDVENGLRGYALVREALFLKPMVAAEGKIPGVVDQLTHVTAPWPDLQGRVRVLAQRIDELLRISRELTMKLEKGRERDVLAYLRSGEGVVLADTIALAFQDLERRIEQRERNLAEDLDRAALRVRIGLVVTILGTLGVGIAMGRHDLRSVDRLEAASLPSHLAI